MQLPKDFDPTVTPGYLISRIARLLARRNDAVLAESGISAAWLPVLGALRNGEALSQKALARHAQIGQPAAAQMLANMQRAGVLVSTADPADGRGRLYKLTDRGRRHVVPAVSAVRDANEAAFAVLSKSRQKELVALLREISEALEPELSK